MANAPSPAARYGMRFIALAYLAFLLVVPVGLVVWHTFENGIGPFWDALSSPFATHAFKVTLKVAITATILNTIFGLVVSLLLVRHDFPGKRVLNILIDLPLAVSPVIVGLALILVYGRLEPIGGWFDAQGIDIIFATPGMVMATVFVSLPLVVRAVVPVLQEVGMEQEQAAWTLGASPLQTFRRITLPAIRWGLAYGVVLALARALGEFGAVAVVSGRIRGRTQTLTLFVQERFQNLDEQAAYAAAFALAAVAVIALIAMQLFRPEER